MAKQQTSGKKASPAAQPQREVDRLFAQYAAYHQHPTNKLLQRIFVPLFLFGVFGLVWAIPFPRIAFLGERHDMVNWASFLMAVSIFYYYKLSPVLSYFILFTLFGFSYLITALQRWEQAGGGALWQTCLVVFAIALTGMWLGYAAEKKNPGIKVRLKHIVIAPAYLWHLILNKLSVKH